MSFYTLLPTPYTRKHSLTKDLLSCVTPMRTVFLRPSCCLSAASLMFLNRIDLGGHKKGALFVVPAMLLQPSLLEGTDSFFSVKVSLALAKWIVVWDKALPQHRTVTSG